ncbi:hypothetical protein SAMN02745134_02372 [Clostridium acidisoli DSM 12555]|uniref:Uncharacterized protein n=1 Tax=Clostridium acidisoli DSM 12555 TaxID=1121291 RepID=A0A1W1XMQ0_9CLOT|nr:hypothetical protein [Clostridium acidisoli]SMC25125.1 hypothetical protein SAMN02745134_02372 [Clostridium acidisoli DSM 12555]
MSFTKSGTPFEKKHGRIIYFTFFFGILSFVPFFIMGLRVKKREWFLFGFVYLLIYPCSYLSSFSNKFISNIGTLLLLILWIASIIHAFSIKKEYLLRYEVILDETNKFDAKRKSQYKDEYDKKLEIDNIKENIKNKSYNDLGTDGGSSAFRSSSFKSKKNQ